MYQKQENTLKPYKLLIVDDEYHIRKGLLSFPWNSIGFSVAASASNGVEALKLMESEAIDVLLTDVRMPYMDGLSLSAYAKDHYPHCAMVIISGYRNFEYAQTAIHVGVIEYLLKPIDQEELKTVFLRVARQLDARSRSDNPPAPEIDTGTFSDPIEQAADYIRRHYQDPVTLEVLADQVSLSTSYLSTQFKKQIGKGFSEYLTDIRMEKAKQLLRLHYLKVYEIAEMVGFHNTKYFTDIFRKHTGVPPLTYRKSV